MKCDLIGVVVVSWRNFVTLWGELWDFKSPKKVQWVSLAAACRSRYRTLSYHIYLHAAILSAMRNENNGLNLWKYKQAPIKCFFVRVVMVLGVFSQQCITKTIYMMLCIVTYSFHIMFTERQHILYFSQLNKSANFISLLLLFLAFHCHISDLKPEMKLYS